VQFSNSLLTTQKSAAMTEEQKAIEQLRNESHTIGDPYVSHEGRFFVVVDGVAMSPGDALRLAKGLVSLEDLKYPD
jgi:hypothetical protein